MSFNGSGTFNINSTGQPVVTGTVISSSVFNALTADLATGLSTCITKDGQTTVTADIPMNSFKFTNLAAGTAAGDSVRVSQLQAGSATSLTVTGTNTYAATASPALTAYTTGNTFSFVVPNSNTSSCTLNIDSLGAKAITRDGTTALVSGDLVAGSEVLVVYDGTRFQVVNSNSKTNFNVSTLLTATTINLTSALGATYAGGSTNATYTSAGQIAIKRSNSSPYMTFHGDGGTRIGYLQMQQTGLATLMVEENQPLAFGTNGTESARFESSGNLLVGTTTAGAGVGYAVRLAVDGGGAEAGIFKTSAGTSAYPAVMWNTATSGNNLFVLFGTEGTITTRGSITYNRAAGQVAYNITSDARLKDNIADSFDAGSKVDALQVRQFDWKETGNHIDYGFVAQELDAVVPHAVTKHINEAEMWSVDYSKLVPILVKELQSLRARVAQLENK